MNSCAANRGAISRCEVSMRTSLLVRTLVAFACVSGGAGGANATPTALVPAADDPTGFSYVAEQLAPRVFALHQREPFHAQPRGNVEVIEQNAAVVLVDSGGSRAGADEVISFVRSQTNKPVTAIVLTHWHG